MPNPLEVTLDPSEVEKKILKRIKSVIIDGEYQAVIIPPVSEKWEGKMTKEEIKLQCLRVASDVLGAYPGAAAYTENAGNKPSVDEVLEKAKLIFEWVTNG